MKRDRKNGIHYPKTLKIRIFGGILYIIILLSIFILLIISNVNVIISILLIVFLFLLGIGPIISGFNKQRLHSLFHRRTPRSNEIKETPVKRVNNLSLNFEYKSALLKKCSKCGMLLIGSVKICPNCGNRELD